MTPDKHANHMNPKHPSGRDGAARPATATRMLEHGQNRQALLAMMVGGPVASVPAVNPPTQMLRWCVGKGSGVIQSP
jgi:hypothetical protein